MFKKLFAGLKGFFKHLRFYPTDTKGGFKFNWTIKF